MVAVGFLLLALISVMNSQISGSKPHKTVSAEIKTSDNLLVVKNTGADPWPTLTVYLKGKSPFTYNANIPALGAGESYQLRLSEFSTDSEQRSAPEKHSVTEVINSQPSESKPYKTVSAEINASDYLLMVKNTGADPWPTLSVYLNGTPPFTYNANIPALGAGESYQLRLAEFLTDSGKRFAPDKYSPTEVWIGGGGFVYKQYRFR
jgi:hypothetical protein